MNNNAIEILKSFVLDKKIEFLIDTKHKDWIKDVPFNRDSIGPFSEDEVWNNKEIGNLMNYVIIPPELYNKKFSLDEFDVHVQQFTHSEVKANGYSISSDGRQGVYFNKITQWNVIIVYCGVHMSIGKYRRMGWVKADHCSPKQRNWHWLKPTSEKPYILKDYTLQFDFSVFNKLEKFFKKLDLNSLVLEDDTLPKQPWYDFDDDYKDTPKLLEINRTTIDYEKLIKKEIKKNIYTPEKATIERLLFSFKGESYSDHKVKNIDRDILKKLAVDTIQLRADSHFDLNWMFNLKGLNIKAPQKVIERYDYQKLKIDPKLAEKIKKDQEQKDRDYKLEEYNNEFSLVQHGKTILKNVQSDEIIEYIENYRASENNFDKNVIKDMEPIFKAFPSIDKFYIAYWGTFYKYELSGKRYEVTQVESGNDHIDDDILTQIYELYELPIIDDKIVEIKYGWPDRGGMILGVKKNKSGKLVLFTEDYDFE